MTLSSQSQLTYAISGAIHVLVKDKTPFNSSIHKHNIYFFINKITGDHPHSQLTRDPPSAFVQSFNPVLGFLNIKPLCFVSDSDIQLYIIDTGTNRVIVNNQNLLSYFIDSTRGVKGIGGNSLQI